MVCSDRFFFALFSLFRFTLSVGLLERPLVVGLFWGVFTGDFVASFNIAIFFELFWLDLIPVGTFISPHLTAATFAALSLSTFLGLESPSRIMLVLFATMPLAWLGTRLEAFLREQERGSYNQLLNWARNPLVASLPSQLVVRSLVRTFTFSGVSFYISILLMYYGFKALFAMYPTFMMSFDVQWAHLWIAASIGGVVSLRLKRAYGVLLAGILLYALFMFSTRF